MKNSSSPQRVSQQGQLWGDVEEKVWWSWQAEGGQTPETDTDRWTWEWRCSEICELWGKLGGAKMVLREASWWRGQCSSVRTLSRARLLLTPWTIVCQTSLYVTNSQSLLQLRSIELMMSSHHLIPCCPFLLLPAVFPSMRVFSSESVLCIRWPKFWSFSFSISPSNEYSGLISFRMDWLDLLAVQGTLKSLLQHHSSKASILWHSAFSQSNSHIHTWLLEKP